MKSANRAITSFQQAGPVRVAELPQRCVWTSHLHGDRHDPAVHHGCDARIPVRAVAAAWRRELELRRASAGFFHFSWRGQVWLGYGMPDGTVRGVYCPTHRAEREQRLGYDPELVIAPQSEPQPEPVAAYAG